MISTNEIPPLEGAHYRVHGKVHAASLAIVILVTSSLHAYDCNANGVGDFDDVASGTSLDCNENGIPDECDIAPVNYAPEVVAHWIGSPSTEVTHTISVADFDGDGNADVVVTGPFFASLGWGTGERRFHRANGFNAVTAEVISKVGIDTDGDGQAELFTLPDAPAPLVMQTFDENRRPGVPDTAARVIGATGVYGFRRKVDSPRSDVVVLAGVEIVLLERAAEVTPEGTMLSIKHRVRLGFRATCAESADFDGDGLGDIAVGTDQNSVAIVLTRDEGTPPSVRHFSAGAGEFRSVVDLAAADFDGDDAIDLAIAHGARRVAFIFGDGNGGFSTPLSYETSTDVVSIAAIDSERDNDLDLAVVGPPPRMFAPLKGWLAILHNHGTRRFGPPVYTRTAGPYYDLVTLPPSRGNVAKEDEDPYLVTYSTGRDGLTWFASRLSQNSIDCDMNAVPDDCQIDCNRDGVPDECEVRSLKSRDCDADGRLDECELEPTPLIVPGPLFEEATGTRFETSSFLAGDVNGDNDLDLIEFSPQLDLLVHLGDGGGAFTTQPPSPTSLRRLDDATLVDLEGDGDLDIVSVTQNRTIVNLGAGDGTFSNSESLPIRISDARSGSFSAADLDRDGDADFLVSERGSFHVLRRIDSGDYVALDRVGGSGAQIANLEGGGSPEIFASDRDQLTVYRVPADPADRVLRIVRETIWETRPADLVLRDLDGDGDTDLLLIWSESLEVFENDGVQFLARARTILPQGPLGIDTTSKLTLIDIDGDGDLDFLRRAPKVTPSPRVFVNHGGTHYEHGPLFPVVNSPNHPEFSEPLRLIAAGDLDGDGRDDLVAEHRGPLGSFRLMHQVLFNRTLPAIARDANGNQIPDTCEHPTRFHRGDVRSDGSTTITDPIRILEYLFSAGSEPSCLETADVDNDGQINLTDPVALLTHLFAGGPPPAPPGRTGIGPCGIDPDPPGSAGDLGCEEYTGFCPG